MQWYRLDAMVGGWFIGDFDPAVLRTPEVEVGVKLYKADVVDAAHHHRIATEITVIVSGRARMGGREVGAGDIVVIEPNETSHFIALTEVVLVVVKLPSVKNDKYLDVPIRSSQRES